MCNKVPVYIVIVFACWYDAMTLTDVRFANLRFSMFSVSIQLPVVNISNVVEVENKSGTKTCGTQRGWILWSRVMQPDLPECLAWAEITYHIENIRKIRINCGLWQGHNIENGKRNEKFLVADSRTRSEQSVFMYSQHMKTVSYICLIAPSTHLKAQNLDTKRKYWFKKNITQTGFLSTISKTWPKSIVWARVNDVWRKIS